MSDVTLTVNRFKTRRAFSRVKHTKFKYTIDFPYQPIGDRVCIAFLRLKIYNHEPRTYFDVAIISSNDYHLTVITVIAINMDPPSHEQFMAGVNSTGPDGRPLPAGAAAAARMTAAYVAAQEAERRQDEETFSTASAAIEEVNREEKKAKKKEGRQQKSLVRRLFGSVGDKVAAVIKREKDQ
ncbi:hypothetical protein KCU95_g9346, partial [Aureobasidium melanogenum]